MPTAQKDHVRQSENGAEGISLDEMHEHPSHELIDKVAERAATLDEVKQEFPSLWAHFQECDPCMDALLELIGTAYARGQREQQAREEESARTVVMTAVVAVLAVVLLASGLVLFYGPNRDMAVNRVYAAVAPAVANIEIASSGTKGSGVVFDRDGYVLTNYHVIRSAQDDADIRVTLPQLGQVPATLVGYDVPTDLAVLQVEAEPSQLAVAEFGNSDGVQVGDLAIAIGNPFGLSQTLTVGYISAVGRRLMTNDPYAPDVAGVIQTDAAINPGNSGGPLLNNGGRVIGINTRIESPSRGSVGVGFAISSETAQEVAQEILERGYVRRPFLGVAGRPVSNAIAADLGLPVNYGVLVQQVHPGAPADQIGLRAAAPSQEQGAVSTTEAEESPSSTASDVILEVDGMPVHNQDELNRAISRHDIGEEVELRVWRNGEERMLKTALVERPRMAPGVD